MTGQIEGGRPLLRGKVLGIPVHLDLSFVVVMGILGYVSGFGLRDFGLWLLITPFAVLIHELGHAVTARAAGAHPEIALAGLGGLTTFTPPGPLSRLRSLSISLSGPAIGLAAGFVLLAVDRAVDPLPYTWQNSALYIGEFTCIGWSLLNLLPVLPLDGGQAMRELLPGDPEVRTRRAAAVSVGVALIAAVIAYFWFGQFFLVLFLVLFAVQNALALRGPPKTLPPAQAISRALWLGQPQEARRLLVEAAEREPEPLDLALHGAVLALTGDRDQGHALLQQELARRPQDPNPPALLGLTLALERDWDGLLTLLDGPVGPRIPPSVVQRATAEARQNGRPDIALRLTELASHRP